MKKLLFIFVSFVIAISAFGQSATINGNACPLSPTVCHENVCINSFVDLTADITSGTIDSVRWYEQIDVGSGWGAAQDIGTSLTVSVPVNEVATFGHQYHYTLVVYIGATSYLASTEVFVDGPPTAVLNASSTSFCEGQSITFTASGGVYYEFLVEGIPVQGPSTNNDYITSSLSDGDVVEVVVEDINGCTNTASLVVTVYALPDATNIIPSDACEGEGMDFQYVGLSGSGDWTIKFWDPTHTIQWGPDYTTSVANGMVLDVPIPYGTSDVDVELIDNATLCSNFN